MTALIHVDGSGRINLKRFNGLAESYSINQDAAGVITLTPAYIFTKDQLAYLNDIAIRSIIEAGRRNAKNAQTHQRAGKPESTLRWAVDNDKSQPWDYYRQLRDNKNFAEICEQLDAALDVIEYTPNIVKARQRQFNLLDDPPLYGMHFTDANFDRHLIIIWEPYHDTMQLIHYIGLPPKL